MTTSGPLHDPEAEQASHLKVDLCNPSSGGAFPNRGCEVDREGVGAFTPPTAEVGRAAGR